MDSNGEQRGLRTTWLDCFAVLQMLEYLTANSIEFVLPCLFILIDKWPTTVINKVEKYDLSRFNRRERIIATPNHVTNDVTAKRMACTFVTA